MEGISSVAALYHDWKAGGHGSVDLRHALVQSCDVYFYTVGQRMGIETMASFAHQFGLGEETGIELPSERVGIVPSEAWKRKAKNRAWFPGETISASIGQGYVNVHSVADGKFNRRRRKRRRRCSVRDWSRL